MRELVVADASGLLALWQRTSEPNRNLMLTELTRRVEDEHLGFPREVVEDLDSLDRGGAVGAWAAGLGSHLTPFSPSINHIRRVMATTAALGFGDGLEGLDGKDPSILAVARLGVQLEAEGRPFVILSTDLGELPLRPTMEAYCEEFGWTLIDPTGCQRHLAIKNC